MEVVPQDLLPLFPLGMVLLPGALAALHIFEERYKLMIGEAIEHGSEFGIVLASEKGIMNTGCSAAVRNVVRRYEDGRLDIVAVGRRRFEILTLNDEKAYLQAGVHFFDDEESEPPSEELTRKVALDYARLTGMEQEPEFEGHPALSFRAAQLVEDVNLRQMMLMLRSEAARLEQLAAFLPEYIARQAETGRMRTLARRNGHRRGAVPPE